MEKHTQDDIRPTAALSRYVVIGAAIIAVMFVGWLMFAPADRDLQSAGSPTPMPPSENTGQSAPVPPAMPNAQPSPTQGTGPGGAGSDSSRDSTGPTNRSEGAK